MSKKLRNALIGFFAIVLTAGFGVSLTNQKSFNVVQATTSQTEEAISWMTDFAGGNWEDPDTHWDQDEWYVDGTYSHDQENKRLCFINTKNPGYFFSNRSNDENSKFLVGGTSGSYFVYDFDMIAWSYSGFSRYGGLLLSLGSEKICNSVSNIQYGEDGFTGATYILINDGGVAFYKSNGSRIYLVSDRNGGYSSPFASSNLGQEWHFRIKVFSEYVLIQASTINKLSDFVNESDLNNWNMYSTTVSAATLGWTTPRHDGLKVNFGLSSYPYSSTDTYINNFVISDFAAIGMNRATNLGDANSAPGKYVSINWTNSDTYTYTGNPVIPTDPVVKYNGIVLKKDLHFTLSYENNVECGNATCVITFIPSTQLKAQLGGIFSGTRRIGFTITKQYGGSMLEHYSSDAGIKSGEYFFFGVWEVRNWEEWGLNRDTMCVYFSNDSLSINGWSDFVVHGDTWDTNLYRVQAPRDSNKNVVLWTSCIIVNMKDKTAISWENKRYKAETVVIDLSKFKPKTNNWNATNITDKYTGSDANQKNLVSDPTHQIVEDNRIYGMRSGDPIYFDPQEHIKGQQFWLDDQAKFVGKLYSLGQEAYVYFNRVYGTMEDGQDDRYPLFEAIAPMSDINDSIIWNSIMMARYNPSTSIGDAKTDFENAWTKTGELYWDASNYHDKNTVKINYYKEGDVYKSYGEISYSVTSKKRIDMFSVYVKRCTTGTCDINGYTNLTNLKTDWDNFTVQYGQMCADSKSIFRSADGYSDEYILNRAASVYDYIASKYYSHGFDNFAERNVTFRTAAFHFDLFNGSTESNNTLMIVVVSMITLCAFSYLLIKRKKEENDK